MVQQIQTASFELLILSLINQQWVPESIEGDVTESN